MKAGHQSGCLTHKLTDHSINQSINVKHDLAPLFRMALAGYLSAGATSEFWSWLP